MPTHPVAMIGSEYLETQRTIIVPTAILWAARNIHHSPLPHSEKLLSSKASEGTCKIQFISYYDQTPYLLKQKLKTMKLSFYEILIHSLKKTTNLLWYTIYIWTAKSNMMDSCSKKWTWISPSQAKWTDSSSQGIKRKWLLVLNKVLSR